MHNVVHAISMITSTRAITLLPTYTKRYLPELITTRQVQEEAPTVDLILAYHKANKSPILKLLLSRIGKLAVSSPSVSRIFSISQSRTATSAGLTSRRLGKSHSGSGKDASCVA